ncbi:Chs6p Ecym_6348 [Eremothecium cymbalariae DBVPG|uniref:Uncharacterized protein n=1 Tax=Eremothecium cymbalariae (strain CBS 270.75 / DBVPG 7215 / KCTC 17166 / NRRL Y-17582) TaxID=931890 RepID=G8JUE4_ERECY|nr:hypothetical protein Ecym_6348 [Eremothecium cymbalariae DBVPG\
MVFFWNRKPKKQTRSIVSSTSGLASHEGILDMPSSSFPPDMRKSTTSSIQHPRIIESQLGEALTVRSRLLMKLAANDKVDIGPPDLVHVTEFDKYHQVEVGEHHYVTGLDVSSEAMPIAYLNTLRWDQSSNCKNEKQIATYCTFNIFSKVDLRIRFVSEKRFQINVLDYNNSANPVQLSDELWEETFVSGCIRCMVMNRDRGRKAPGLVEYPIGIDNGVQYCENVISSLCKFLPRGIESGCDSTIYMGPTILQNYLVTALLTFLSLVSRSLYHYTVDYLDMLMQQDTRNAFCYRLVQIKVLMASNSYEFQTIKKIQDAFDVFFPNFPSLSLLEFKNIIDLLNLEVEFLINKQDYELALPLAKRATELITDNFQAWYNLALCYIELGQYESALYSINSMPRLSSTSPGNDSSMIDIVESKYYNRPLGSEPVQTLLSGEYNHLFNTMPKINSMELRSLIYGRIVMSKPTNRGGCIEEIWNGPCLTIGPIYGPQGSNLVNFVSKKEVKAIKNTLVIERNTTSNKLSPGDAQVYDLLIRIVHKISWNSLLKLRSSLFVMQREHMRSSVSLNREVKNKRLCEKWLDRLFMDLYDDLKICTNIPLHNKNVENSGLEWQLLGLTLLRTWYYEEAIACLRTSILARFDTVAAERLLQLYISGIYKEDDIDVILHLLTSNASYAARFHDWCQWLTVQTLYKLCEEHSKEIIRTRLYGFYLNNNSIRPLMEKFLDQIDTE